MNLRRMTLWVVLAILCSASGLAAGEVLYNGIRLSDPWPPKIGSADYTPMRLPYLESPPEVIPIDVGRQLFVDDFLIEETTLERTFHQAEYHSGNPVLRPDRPWEMVDKYTKYVTKEQHDEPHGTAMPFSDGVWYDPADGLFKMWYMGGYVASTCLAISKDGITWNKPTLDVEPGTNIVLAESPGSQGQRDSTTVWLDLEEKDPTRRFKLFLVRLWKDPTITTGNDTSWTGFVYFSADGVHWGEPVACTGHLHGDRSTVFYNPFRKVWVYSTRTQVAGDPRWRGYFETPDLAVNATQAVKGSPAVSLWVGADRYDQPRPGLRRRPQLYNLDAVAYESLTLGLFTIWPGQPEDRAKPNYVCLGFSRDGFHWGRPDHRPFANVSEHYGDWNWGNVQSAGGGCLVVGDKLYFYVSGRSGIKGTKASGVSATGLAILRRDGFASMDAGDAEGTLTTRPLQFTGKHLFVNLDAPQGRLQVEVLDAEGNVIAPFAKENCETLTADSTLAPVQWRGLEDLSTLAGKTVRLRFHLTGGGLYAFWVSPDRSGASHGYVAAGGPGFNAAQDTVGAAAYDAARRIQPDAKQKP